MGLSECAQVLQDRDREVKNALEQNAAAVAHLHCDE